jgi:CRP-like cAMP-binding protein
MVVYTKGEQAGVMYILLSGTLGSIGLNDEVSYIEQYEVLGMSALKGGEYREETVLTEEPSQLLCLVGEHYRDIIQQFNLVSNTELKLLSKVHFFSKMFIYT